MHMLTFDIVHNLLHCVLYCTDTLNYIFVVTLVTVMLWLIKFVL